MVATGFAIWGNRKFGHHRLMLVGGVFFLTAAVLQSCAPANDSGGLGMVIAGRVATGCALAFFNQAGPVSNLAASGYTCASASDSKCVAGPDLGGGHPPARPPARLLPVQLATLSYAHHATKPAWCLPASLPGGGCRSIWRRQHPRGCVRWQP